MELMQAQQKLLTRQEFEQAENFTETWLSRFITESSLTLAKSVRSFVEYLNDSQLVGDTALQMSRNYQQQLFNKLTRAVSRVERNAVVEGREVTDRELEIIFINFNNLLSQLDNSIAKEIANTVSKFFFRLEKIPRDITGQLSRNFQQQLLDKYMRLVASAEAIVFETGGVSLSEDDYNEIASDYLLFLESLKTKVIDLIAVALEAILEDLTTAQVNVLYGRQMLRNYFQQILNKYVRTITLLEAVKLAEQTGEKPRLGRGQDEGPREVRN